MNEAYAVINSFFSATMLAQFHFLRPLWLLSIIPAMYLAVALWRQKGSAAHWRGAINEQLIEHLLEPGNRGSTRWPWPILLVAWIISGVAMAGPTWEKLPQPVHQRQDALVIILDLSLSMRAEDIKPSRLVRARHKILDILNKRNEGLTALIVYSGDAHIVSPLTDDNATVANLVPALSPAMMPAYGSDPVSALHLAHQLFKNAGLDQGRILLATDGITDNDLEDIDNTISRSGFELSVLGIGTTQGAPIPTRSGFLKDNNGTIVVPQLPRQQLNELARFNDGRYIDISLDDNDIEFLLPATSTDLNEKTIVSERDFDQWRDSGHLLVLCLIPFALLAFRRGWLLVLPLLILTTPQYSQAFEWQDLWQRADQRAAKALEQGDAKTAADTFKDKKWQGAAQYKTEDYEAAANNFSQFDSVDAHYNRGNALAKAGKLDEAIKAYDEALKQQPDMEDALFNKNLLEQLKQQQQSSEQNNDENADSQQSDNNDQQQKDQQSDQQQNSDSEKNNNNSPNTDNQQDNSEQSKNTESPPQDANDGAELPDEQEKQQAQHTEQKEDEQQSESTPSQQEQQQPDSTEQQAQLEQQQIDKEDQQKQQAMEQWLRQIPDDPSGLLRRKFDYEHRLRQQQQKQNNREQPQW